MHNDCHTSDLQRCRPYLPYKAKKMLTGLCLLAPDRQLLNDPKYQNMPRLYFLSTDAEISKITNPKTVGFQQCLDMFKPDSVQI